MWYVWLKFQEKDHIRETQEYPAFFTKPKNGEGWFGFAFDVIPGKEAEAG